MNANERLTVEFCWCGLEHAIPNNLSRMAAEEGKEIFCPLGHKWHSKTTETQKLRAKLGFRERDLSEANMEIARLERKVRRLESKKKKAPKRSRRKKK